MDGSEMEEGPRAAVDAMMGKRRGKKSAAAIVEPEPTFHSEAPLLLEPGSLGENADCNSQGFKTVIEEEEEDISEGSFEVMAQPDFITESGPLSLLPANNSISDGLTRSPKTIDEDSSSIWHTLSTWWKKDPKKKHTINWADIEIDVCPPPHFVEEPWQLSSPDFTEEPWQDSPPEHHEPELEAPPSPINDYSSSGWFTLTTWWSKEKRERQTLTSADIDACPPPGYTEESGMFWIAEHESDFPTTEEPTVLSRSKPVVGLTETIDEELGDSEVLSSSSLPLPRQSRPFPSDT